MTQRIHREWTIDTWEVKQGYVFQCSNEQGSEKAYGYYQTDEEAMLAAMIWIDQGKLTDHMDGILHNNDD